MLTRFRSQTQVYRKTYSWAHNGINDANWAAYITIAKAPGARQSEEDMERGVGSDYGIPVQLLKPCLMPARYPDYNSASQACDS